MSTIDNVMDNALNSDEDLSPENIMLNAVEQVNNAVSEMQDCSAILVEKAQQLANHERQIASSDTLGHFKLGSGFEIDEENRININGTADFNTALQTLNTELQAKIDAIPEVSNSTTSARGIIQLASSADVEAGTDDEKAVTVASLQSSFESKAESTLSNVEACQEFITTSIAWGIPDYENIVNYDIPEANVDIIQTALVDGMFFAGVFGHNYTENGVVKINGIQVLYAQVNGGQITVSLGFPVRAGDVCTYRTGTLHETYRKYSFFYFVPFFKGDI